MRHRLAGRGGARNEQRDLLDEVSAADGLTTDGCLDSDTLVEECPLGCQHDGPWCALPTLVPEIGEYPPNFIPPGGRHDPSCKFLCRQASCWIRHECSVCREKLGGMTRPDMSWYEEDE